MKKIKNTIGLILMYFGAWLQDMKYILIAAVLLSAILTSCASAKYGCPPSRIERKPFRN